MTDEERLDIRKEFHKVADLQADEIIRAIEHVDATLPKEVSKAQRDAIISNMARMSSEVTKQAFAEMAKNMNKEEILEKAMGAVNVG